MSNEPVFLYVEDDANSREIMELMLIMKLGYSELILFEDSSDFMARVEALPQKPDVFFLDIHMTPYDGFELLKKLRNHDEYQDVTIVALTASVMSDEVDQLRNAGFNGVIAKPLDKKLFPELLERILDGEEVWHVVD